MAPRTRPSTSLAELLAPWLAPDAVPEPALRAAGEGALLAAGSAGLAATPRAHEVLAEFLRAGGVAAPLPPPAPPPGEARLAWPGQGQHLALRAGGEAVLVPRAPRAELLLRLASFARETLLPAEAAATLPAGELARRASELAATVELGRAALEPLLRVAEARRAVWRKPRLVLAAERCLVLARVPAALRRELLGVAAVRAAWEREAGQAVPRGAAEAQAWLETRPNLPVDTGDLPAPLRERLLVGLGDQLDRLEGLFFLGENDGALALAARRLAGRVRLAYLDPPFNTACERRGYKDAFESATWLSFVDDRLARVTPLLTPDGTLYAHIDGHEKERLRLVLDRHLHHVGEIVWRIGWCSGFKTRAKKFLRNHDTIYHYGRGPKPLFVKQHIPYPEGYVRRDGKPPRGAGYPLEDTWNCSPMDRLDSIQIVSFSREKVGDGCLTQKPEALLLRMLEASSLPGDWVLDPFAGSGTTCAAALKSGRRFVGIEWAAAPLASALPRLRRVIAGDRHGISKRTGWTGGGAFAHVRLESFEEALAALDAPGRSGLAYRLDEAGRLRLEPRTIDEPFGCRLAGGGPQVDLVESLAWLLGLDGRQLRRVGPVLVLTGAEPAGAAVVCLWRRTKEAGERELCAALDALPSELLVRGGRILVNGAGGVEAIRGVCAGWTVEAAESALEALLQPD